MKTIRNLTLAAIVALTGCGGFGKGMWHAVTGEEVATEEKSKTGYDLGVLLGNILILATGYATRHVQGVVMEKKNGPPEPEKK